MMKPIPEEMLAFEQSLWSSGVDHVAGIDEAGRGPLAGPVVAAAVIFKSGVTIDGVNDSKQLSEQERELLYPRIYEHAVSVGVGVVDHATIDEMNILNATFHSMGLAVERLAVRPGHLLIDGPRFTGSDIPFTTVIGGDGRSFSIAAASIIAKVTRDRLMKEYDLLYPEYGFAKHKGYGTKEHMAALRKYGRCPIHRLSFRMPG